MQNCLNLALDNVKPSAIRQFSNLAKAKEGCISLTLGEPDFATSSEICAEVKKSLDNGDTHYIMNNGALSLREKISAFEKQKHNLDYSTDEIIVTVGATEGIFDALFGILNPDDEVIVPTPAFGLYESTILMCRGKFVAMPTGDNNFQITKEMLLEKITSKTKAIILNSPNNPTGCILNEESLKNVYEIVRDKNIFVIVDDVYNQLIYVDKCPSFANFSDIKKQIIVVQSFSKPYAMTGWRVGYIMCDKSIAGTLAKVHQFSVVSTASIVQQACIKALDSDISPMLNIYRKRRDFVLKRLQEIGLECVLPEGGFYVFPSIKKFGLTSSEFCTRMIDEVSLAVTPGFCFGDDSRIRLTYCYSDDELVEGLNRLEKFVNILNNGE